MEFNDYFFQMVDVIKLKSKDQNTQIGVLIVGPDNAVRSTGYNSFPRGINDNKPERQERPEKYFWFEHAERNAIYNAARIGVSTEGCTMYCSCDISCADCARAIINAGISKVVFTKGGGAKGLKWDESAERSKQMFEEAGVIVVYGR